VSLDDFSPWKGIQNTDHWKCLIFHESTFQFCIVGGKNTDGSKYFGTFQFNKKYWCKGPGHWRKDVCGVPCSNFQDTNLNDDLDFFFEWSNQELGIQIVDGHLFKNYDLPFGTTLHKYNMIDPKTNVVVKLAMTPGTRVSGLKKRYTQAPTPAKTNTSVRIM
jgi:hypothetical protein